MSSSESELETPPAKKMCSSQSSIINRVSSRQSEKAQKWWAVFDFAEDHSLLTVPAGWVRTIKKSDKTGTTRVKTKCFWPKKGSADELNVQKLIRVCSDPDVNKWDLLAGVLKGFYNSLRDGDAYITEKLGTVSTSSSAVTDLEDLLEKKAALAVKKKTSYRPSPRTFSDIVSRSPTPNVARTPTSMSQTGHNPSPSTCTSNSILDVNAESGDESQSMQVTSERKAVDGRYKADLNGAVTPRPQGRRLYDDVQESVRNKTKGDERKENQVSGKRRDIQEQTLLLHLLQELKKDVQELKEDVRLIKNRMDMLDPKCGENKTVETTLENPFEILRSFGFRANSLEETEG